MMRLPFISQVLGASFVLALASASPALSADLAAPWQPAAAPSPWAGLYAGSIFGFGIGSYRASQAASAEASRWGSTTGALVGYDFQEGNFIFGPEGDLVLNSIRAKIPGVTPGLVPTIGDAILTTHLRMRLGYDFGQFMPFVAGGVAFSELYQKGNPPSQYGQRREVTGFTIGAGLEYRFVLPILGPTTLRGEYLYDAFPSQTFSLPGGPVRTSSSAQYFRLALLTYPGSAKPGASDSGVVDWSGGYVGAMVGGIWAKPRTSLNGVTTTTSASGPAFGVYSGYNFTFGPVVLGFDGATEYANVRGSGAQPTIASASYHQYFETDLRGRAGYAIGRFLPYFTAGLAFGRNEQVDGATGSDQSNIPTESFTIGGGLEYMIDDHWAARGEWLYDHSFKDETTNLDGLPLRESLSEQKIRFGLAYYFH